MTSGGLKRAHNLVGRVVVDRCQAAGTTGSAAASGMAEGWRAADAAGSRSAGWTPRMEAASASRTSCTSDVSSSSRCAFPAFMPRRRSAVSHLALSSVWSPSRCLTRSITRLATRVLSVSAIRKR